MANAFFQEGTEITVDQQTLVGSAGWTLGYVAIHRLGGYVSAHIEASFLAAAALTVLTLPADFRPNATVTSADGLFTITAAGVVAYTGSVAAPGTGRCQVSYTAGAISP